MSRNKKNLTGKEYWRSLDQLADTPDFRKFLEQEFPEVASDNGSGISRRKFISLMGASLALAGLAGCRRPVEKIIPYVQQPEEVVPGVPNYYATSMPFGSTAYGLVVECHEGRPTKIEGNELHPSSRGRSNGFMQAEILNLYDPDRSQNVLKNGVKSSWKDFVAFWNGQFESIAAARGGNMAILTGEFSSPTLARLARSLRGKLPQAQFITYEPLAEAGQSGDYRFDCHYDKANVILALDADFLGTESENIKAASRFADGRRLSDTNDRMSRLYVVEPDMTITGAMADHRLRVPRSAMAGFLSALIYELNGLGVSIPGGSANKLFDQKWLTTVAGELAANRGRSIVIAGRSFQHNDMIRIINEALGNIGETVTLNTAPVDTASTLSFSAANNLKMLEDQIEAGTIKTVICAGCNPVYDSPGGMRLGQLLGKVENLIHFGSHVDETGREAAWHIPRAHFLEGWGDTRSTDDVLGIIQPMIEPLFGGHSDVEFYNLLAGGGDKKGYDIVRETWGEILRGGNFEKTWRRVLHDGVYLSEKSRGSVPRLGSNEIDGAIAALDKAAKGATKPSSADNLEVTFQPSPSLFDGRYGNVGWMQELPHPITKLTWDNAACISPKTARELNLQNGDVVKVSNQNGEIEIPAWIVPGQIDYTISLTCGYGRTAAGRVGNGVGINVYKLRSGVKDYFAAGAKITGTGRRVKLASTQDHGAMAGRPIVREASLDEYRKDPEFAREMVEHPPLEGIYPEHDYSQGYQWGMTIDLNACTGCNACTIACQSENNIPVVGKERVLEGREMHWIRLDRYFTGETDNPEMVFMPVACQQCENAPCEQVCPVAATVHDREGLNVMTYNRCIGTRYCSNNCPYKVRRFNFFNYTKDLPEIVRMAMNPDVTVRFRGVMEKCTFCTQRISRAKIKAKGEGRSVVDGEITTACQQACPAGAIVFGDINNSQSKVAATKMNKRSYGLLAELNLRTRNTFLARIRNPHPDLIDYEPDAG